VVECRPSRGEKAANFAAINMGEPGQIKEDGMSIPKAEGVKSLAVMGFGTMGHTWSAALLLGGLDVFVYEADPKIVEANTARVKGYLESLKKKGKWDGDVESTFAKINVLEKEADLAECGAPVLLEVIYEDLQLKCDTYKRLGEIMPKDTIFWTNTSCLDVERMGEASGRPEMFLGTHGMNPVHLMKGVEVVRHPKLNQDVLDTTIDVLKRINKDPFVTENVPGFIVNNGLIPWMIHYTNMLERKQATTEDIDKALKSSLGHPQGVFLLTDFIGVNTTILVAEELYEATLDPRYIAPPLLYKMREAGWDGFKTGRGFYDWSDRKNPKPIAFEDLTKPKE
jgi:3-hydroxybutyryl-CoA dehydrogenase